MSWLPWTREKSEPIDRARSLTAIPVLNEGVDARKGNNERLIITVTYTPIRKGWVARVVAPRTHHRKFKLDELGTFTFGLIDGKREVREIIDLFQRQFRVNRREAELSCVEFMKMLAARYVISLVIK